MQTDNNDGIPPDVLAIVGMALLGHHWQRPMAEELSINERTVRRWAKDGAPAWARDVFLRMFEQRERELTNAARILKQLRTPKTEK